MPFTRTARSRRHITQPARVESIEPRRLLSGTVLLNEIEANDPGKTDNRYQYIELAGTPGLALTNDWFVAFDGTAGTTGVADLAVNLSSYSLGSDGLLVIQSSATAGQTLPAATTLVADPSYFTVAGGLPNGSLSFYLYNSTSPFVAGYDYDQNDDGTLDNLPAGATAIDHIAIPDTNNKKDIVYGGVTVAENTALNKGTADAVTRFPGNTSVTSAAWYGGELVDTNNVDSQLQYDITRSASNEPVNAWLTPGAVNDTPLFNQTSFSFALAKPAAIGASVGTVLATPVGTDTETYAITGTGSGNFSISGSGQITLAANASASSYPLTVSATDNQTAVASSVPLTITLSRSGSSVALASSNSSASYAQPVTFTATVSPVSTTTGTVQFLLDGATYGPAVTLSAGVASVTTSALPAGTHTISAIYSGDGNFSGASQGLQQTISTAAINLSTPAAYIELDSNPAYLDIWSNNTASGNPAQRLLLSSVKSITTQSASTVVDFSSGNPAPSGGLNITTGALTVIGSAGNDSVTTATGSITIDGTVITTPGVTSVSFAPGAGVDSLNVASGQLTLIPPVTTGTNPAMNFSSITIGPAALLKVGQATPPAVVITSGLTIAAAPGSWLGTLDLAGNDMIVRGGNLGTLSAQVGSGYDLPAGGTWTGLGITSSVAAADSTHLSAVGVVQNKQSGTPLFSAANPFDGVTPNPSDILIKSTIFGDANLDGAVDGSDYTLIDGAAPAATGWMNGDFNYDGFVDGSDYALIDNAFNNQPAATTTARAAAVLASAAALGEKIAPAARAAAATPVSTSAAVVAPSSNAGSADWWDDPIHKAHRRLSSVI